MTFAATEQVLTSLQGVNGLHVEDLDAATSELSVLLQLNYGDFVVDEGTLPGLAVEFPYPGFENILRLRGSQGRLNALLEGQADAGFLSYLYNSNSPHATDTLYVDVSDQGYSGAGGTLTDAETFTFNIIRVNDPPSISASITLSATEQVPLSLQGQISISDDAYADNVQLTLTVDHGILQMTPGTTGLTNVTGSSTGTLTVTGPRYAISTLLNLLSNAGSTLQYVANSDMPSPSATLVTNINDLGSTGAGGPYSDSATTTINITAINDVPVASTNSYATPQGTALNVASPGVLANDFDPEGAALTAQLGTGPQHGTLTLNANGSFQYAPSNPTFTGTDSFTYRASDGSLFSDLITVLINIG